MTLLELLVKILPDIGGFPEDCIFAAYRDGYVKYYYEYDGFMMPKPLHLNQVSVVPDDCYESLVTRDQYESALAASQKVEWDGVGLPPVGAECEYIPGMLGPTSYDDNKPIEPTIIKVVAHEQYPNGGNDVVVGVWMAKSGGMRSSVFSPRCCVPLRTEAERKRDDVCDKIYGAMTNAERKDNRSDMAEAIYDAIAAGKIPGVKLED